MNFDTDCSKRISILIDYFDDVKESLKISLSGSESGIQN